MALEWLTRALATRVASADATHWYAVARTAHPALTPYAAFGDVLGALRERAPDGAADRDGLLRALVTEYQRAKSPSGAAVLLGACLPMLGALRRRVQGHVLGAEDLDQLVVVAFLENALRAPVRTSLSVCVWLQRRTAQRVFRVLRPLQREAQARTDRVLDELPATPPSPQARYAAEALLALGDTCADVHAVVLATVFEQETLSHYVRRVHGDAPTAERAQIYLRLKRRRAAALATLLRAGVSIPCPKTKAPGALRPSKPPRLGGT